MILAGQIVRKQAAATGYLLCRSNFIGLLGFYAGPHAHLVDTFGLADPVISRLPVKDKTNWRIGHFSREIPEGLLEKILTYSPDFSNLVLDVPPLSSKELIPSANAFRDQGLSRFSDNMALITRGDIWDRQRWLAIVKMNLGMCRP